MLVSIRPIKSPALSPETPLRDNVNVGVVISVMLSVLDVPVSLLVFKSGVIADKDAVGAVLSMIKACEASRPVLLFVGSVVRYKL